MRRLDVLELDFLRGVFGNAPFGLAVLDRELRYVYINAALAAMNGRPVEEHAGRTLTEVVPDLAAQVRADFARVVETGEPLVDWEILGETPAQEGVQRSWTENIYPVTDGGEIVGLVAVVMETTAARAVERERDEALRTLDGLFASAPLGLAVYDRELRYLRLNERLAEANGVAVDACVGRTVTEVLPDIGEAVLGLMRRVADGSGAVSGAEVTARTPADPGVDRQFRTAFFPIAGDGDDPRPVAVAGIVEEVTEEVRLRAEQERLRATLVAERRLLGDVVSRVRAGIAVLGGAERRFELANEAFCEMAGLGEDPVGRPAHEVVGDLRGTLELVDEVRTTGTPVARHELDAPSSDPRAWHGRRFFELSLDPLASEGRETPGVLAVVIEITDRVRQADELRRRADRERRIAATLQHALLPPVLPDVAGLDVAARYEAAGDGHDVGGDFYDLFDNADGSWTVVVGDVVGKGPQAAVATAMLRHTVRAEAAHDPAPGHLLGRLNDEVRRHDPFGAGADVGERMLATAVCATVRPDPGGDGVVLTVAAAGHPEPVVLAADGTAGVLPVSGILLGLEAATYVERELALPRGAALVLYTDGVLDAHAPRLALDPAAIAASVQGAAGADAEGLAAAVLALTRRVDGPPRDDIAVVVLRSR